MAPYRLWNVSKIKDTPPGPKTPRFGDFHSQAVPVFTSLTKTWPLTASPVFGSFARQNVLLSGIFFDEYVLTCNDISTNARKWSRESRRQFRSGSDGPGDWGLGVWGQGANWSCRRIVWSEQQSHVYEDTDLSPRGHMPPDASWSSGRPVAATLWHTWIYSLFIEIQARKTHSSGSWWKPFKLDFWHCNYMWAQVSSAWHIPSSGVGPRAGRGSLSSSG